MNTIDEGIADIRAGRMVIVVDDEGRENEGDLVMAARCVTADDVNFMALYGRGLICAPSGAERLAELDLPQMVSANTDNHGTAFSVSVDHRDTSTGISAADRALTLRKLADPSAAAADFRRPGHIFPLAARRGGVFAREGHTEAAVDLVRLAFPQDPGAGVICEIMNPDGSMARLHDLGEFAKTHGLRIISIADLVTWRRTHESAVVRAAETRLPTKHGDFSLFAYTALADGMEHLALVRGNPCGDEAPALCRIHSECLTGDALGSRRCDCGEQYDEAMRLIAAEGAGVLIYLRQEGRGIGLVNKMRAYALQDGGLDTVDANTALGFPPDARSYDAAAAILRDLGIPKVRLLTNNPEKIAALTDFGIEVTERVPLVIEANPENRRYLETKKKRMNHQLEGVQHENH